MAAARPRRGSAYASSVSEASEPASEPDAAPDRLVVYGSLMRGLPASTETIEAGEGETGAARPDPERATDLLDRLGVGAKLRRVGACRVAGALFDLGPYPALRPTSEAAASVRGELHAILDASALAVLDAFEGYDPRDPGGSDYLRECVALQEPAGVRAWIYVYNRPLDPARRIESGDWRRHLAERRSSAHVPDSPPLTTACEPRAPARRATTDEEEEERWDS